MLRFGSINMSVSDMGRAAEFWSSALGYGVRGGSVKEHESAILVPLTSQGPEIVLDDNDRMHIDLYVDSDEELVGEVDRLIRLGARRVDWAYPDDAAFVVLADTEGNLFCVAKVSEG
jgi:catechol 2,3-dioxygenase-like lactoylglutathione lyase family enzyme